MNLISHAEDFKTLSKTLDFNQASTQAATNNLSSHRTNLEPLNFQKIKKRDLNEMIEEVKSFSIFWSLIRIDETSNC